MNGEHAMNPFSQPKLGSSPCAPTLDKSQQHHCICRQPHAHSCGHVRQKATTGSKHDQLRV